MRISELLQRQQHNTKTAISHRQDTLSYAQWHHRAEQARDAVVALDNALGNCIGIYLPNSIDYAVAYFAAIYLGKVLVPIDIHAKPAEIINIVRYCELDLIITNDQNFPYLETVLKGQDFRIGVFTLTSNKGEIFNAEQLPVVSSSAIELDGTDSDVAIMLHTSGTTSSPKRVMLTHHNLIHNIESNIMSLGFTGSEKLLISLPMYFGYCNTAQFLTALYAAASIVIMDSLFLPKQFFSIVEREQITQFTAVPSMLLMLLEYKYADHHDFSSLKYLCFGGGKMPKQELIALIHRYPSVTFIQTYGQTECSPRLTLIRSEQILHKPDSVGRPIPNVTISIMDQQGRQLPPNTIGEIVARGENVMKGYFKQPEITAEVIKGGWLHTGDLGYIDHDGDLFLQGRIKNVIISGGINLYPEEIEEVLMAHKCVEDAYVIGEEHDLLGEVAVAKVKSIGAVTSQQLLRYCSQSLSDYKIPVRIDFVEYIDKTYNGKTKRYTQQ